MARPRTSRSTIRRDPFADVIPVPEPDAAEPATELRRQLVRSRTVENRDRPAPAPPSPPAAAGPAEVKGRQKLTVHLDGDLVNRVKNAAYWNPRLTIARIAAEGIRLAIERIERENGGSYPQRESELVGGRPIR